MKQKQTFVKILNVLLVIAAILLSLMAFILYRVSYPCFSLDEKIALIVGFGTVILFLVSAIGRLLCLKWAFMLNLASALPFIIFMLYVALSPRMLLTEYKSLSFFEKIMTRMPELLIGFTIFILCYYLPSVFINKSLTDFDKSKQ